ncbi:DUF1294 domain-containing protein [Rheinheimera soli]|uniref:DUF1294 domain-containing protein n=1 Tax=Rheinheimera soli TaxID=443616 RepID=UPI001E383EC7|nr:cold shock and DUF1294 domain-containing protein [Rheinheimera soli]
MNPSPLLHGTVCYWRDDKGFGFISTDSGERLFFHIRDFATAPQHRPQQGDQLCFQLGQDKQHRPCALALQLVSVKDPVITPSTKTPSNTAPAIYQIQHRAWCFRYLFFVLLLLSLLAGSFVFTMPLFYLEASLFTYWLYQIDKKLACNGQQSRLPEESLQMFSLIGGWPGAWLAQKRLHHKVHKAPFQREFRFVIYGNSCFLLWLLSDSGSAFLQKVALL